MHKVNAMQYFWFLYFLFKGVNGKVIGNNMLAEMASHSNVQHKILWEEILDI